MNLPNRVLGPWGFRRFVRWIEGSFLPFILILWFGGIGVTILVSIFEFDKRLGVSVNSVALFTLWPVMIAWLGFSGIGVLWKLGMLWKRRDRATPIGKLWFYVWLTVGLLFMYGAVSLALVVLRAKLE